MITTLEIQASLKKIIHAIADKYKKDPFDVSVRLVKDKKCFFFDLAYTIFGTEKLEEGDVDALLEQILADVNPIVRVGARPIIKGKLKNIFEEEAKKHTQSLGSFAISIYLDGEGENEEATMLCMNGMTYIENGEVDLSKYFEPAVTA